MTTNTDIKLLKELAEAYLVEKAKLDFVNGDEYNRRARVILDFEGNASNHIIALCERVEALEAALKPFAEYCNGRTSDLFPDDQNITLGSPMARKQLTIGDCRLARAALKGEP